MVRRPPSHESRCVVVRVGDEVECMYGQPGKEKESYCRVEQIFSVTDPSTDRSSLWFVPLWYNYPAVPGIPRKHPVRKTTLQVKPSDQSTMGGPQLCATVTKQVLLVHNCNRTDAGSNLGVCKTVEICRLHGEDPVCRRPCSCPDKQLVDKCQVTSNLVFEVLDNRLGFVERFA